MARYRILEGKSRWPGQEGGFRIERLSCFFFWTAVDAHNKPFHFEHFSHGNDYDWYKTLAEAEEAIANWEKDKVKEAKRHKAPKPKVVAYSKW